MMGMRWMDTRQLVAYNHMFINFNCVVSYSGADVSSTRTHCLHAASLTSLIPTILLYTAFPATKLFPRLPVLPCDVHASSFTRSSLPLNLSPLLVSTQQLVRNLRHLHVLNPLGNITLFLIKDLLNDGKDVM
jgi:hypothetical protein